MKRIARPLIPFLFLVGWSGVGLLLVGAPQDVQQGRTPRTPPDLTANMKPRSVFGAYYLVGDGFNSTLGLNNSTQYPLTVYPTLYSPSGVRMPMAAVTVDPNQHVQVNMAEWVAQLGGEFRSGSLQLDYDSFLNAIGGQMLVTDENRSLSLDVPIRGRHEHRSSKLEAVWWGFDRQSEMKVAVLNTTDSAVTATVRLTGSDGGEIKALPIPLGPHHSRVINLRDIIAREHGSVGGVSIQHDGRPGAVMAEGFVTLASKGFSSNIRFHDPGTFGGNALHGAGVYLPDEASPFEGHLLLRNISGEVLTARLLLRYGDQEIDLGELTIGPGASKEMTVQKTMSEENAQGTAVEVSYTGTPGSLIGHWLSVGDSGDMVVETPLRNPGPATASSGSHPFKLTEDFESVLFVKNAAAEPSSFFGVIFFRDEIYRIGILDVEPGKTVAINVRKLRDEQIPDGSGKLLPLDLEGGQFQWLHRSGPKMVGRMRILSRSKRISTNMSCGWCSCNPRDVSLRLDPNSKAAQVGDVVQEKVYETNCDCAFNCYEDPIPKNAGNYSWFSNNPFVASPTGPGQITCWWPGTAEIRAETWYTLLEPGVSECESGPCDEVCQEICDGACPVVGQAFFDVSAPPPPPPVTVTLSCPSQVTRGQSANCTVSVQDAGGANITYSNWKFTDGSVTVNRSGTQTSTWQGTMVTSGTVSVRVTVGSTPPYDRSASITVNPRPWHINPAPGIQAANGSALPDGWVITLPVPPQPSGTESGLGEFREFTADLGFTITPINTGPNEGYAYHASTLAMNPSKYYFRYVINPDLENSASVFSQHQCGDYNSSTNPSGFISWSALLQQTRRHEFEGLVQSHYAFYSTAMNAASTNPSEYFESRVPVPGTNLSVFNQDTRNGLDLRYGQIATASEIEPYAVNVSETGIFLGNVNYAPYTACQ